VTDGQTYFSEEKRDARCETSQVALGVPAYQIRNTAVDGGYRIEKEVLTDPWRDVVLQRVRFVPLQDTLADFRLYTLLAPHLFNRGSGNTAWVGDYKGTPMLLAERENFALAAGVLSSVARPIGRVRRHVDGWQQLQADKRLIRSYLRAEKGNVAVTGEVDLGASDGGFVVALGFGPTAMEAGQHALISLLENFDRTKAAYVAEWEAWHLTWPRDLVETAWGFLAVGARHSAKTGAPVPAGHAGARRPLVADMWLDGTPYWQGIQMDETACRLSCGLAAREGVIDQRERDAFWPMMRRAAAFLARNGPVSPQDRWEEDPGYSPFTVAAEIALLVASDSGRRGGQHNGPTYLRETADAWNASIERWLYLAGTTLAQQHGVDGYYVRVAEPDRADAASPCHGFVPIKNGPPDESIGPSALIVSLDALAFVRFGLRAPDDPRIVNTIKVIDAMLKVDTLHGSAWHRYQGDGYGEHADGAPFDGTGIGRAWPLLTGERAHYDLAAGRPRAAEQLAEALEAFAGESGLLPEQVWDSADIPEPGTVPRVRVRISDAARVRARGVPEIAPISWRRRGLRSAAADGSAIPQDEADHITSCDLALQQQGAHDARP
jgi:glucoamylase